MTKCPGCGVTLQSMTATKPGYIPEHKKGPKTYCQRCFRLTNYGQYDPQQFQPIANQKIWQKLNKDHALVFFLVDFLNINNEVMTTFKMINEPKVLLISKSDVLPPRTHKNRIIEQVAKIYDITSPIEFIDYRKSSIINKYATHYQIKKIYLTGYTNSGKSTFINHLIKESLITTSFLPHTTNDYLSLKKDDLTIIDCPGFDYQAWLIPDYKLQQLALNKALKPLTYQIKAPQTIIITPEVALMVSDPGSITLYLPPAFTIKRVYQSPNQLTKELLVPKNSDVIIKTLGFINFKSASLIKVSPELMPFIEIRETIY